MKPFVLVVEDDASLGANIRECLEEDGYDTALARDGEHALQLLATCPIPKLVVLDLVLPRFDGWNLIEVLRERTALPILAISALPQGERDLARGATALLQKPFDLDTFLAEVHRLCPKGADRATTPAPRPTPPKHPSGRARRRSR